MSHNRHDFSRWRSILKPHDMPKDANWMVIQIKHNASLLPYPRGKSAMVWYGAGPSTEQILERASLEIGNHFLAEELVWRYRCTPDAPTELSRLLARFENRFGSLPKMNKTPSAT